MNVLVLTCSPRLDKSSTHQLAQFIVEQISNSQRVETEYVDVTSLPHIDTHYAKLLCAEDELSGDCKGSVAISARLIASLKVADFVIIAAPMHNYFLPSSLKSWVDHVVRAGETFEITPSGKKPLLNDKPVMVLISSGGRFMGESAYQPDFFTPYMTEVLKTIGLNDVHYFAIQGTALETAQVQEQISSLKCQIQECLVKYLS
ncbi:FMN-dependent NADH-azoreductase [Thalassotalea fusca]